MLQKAPVDPLEPRHQSGGMKRGPIPKQAIEDVTAFPRDAKAQDKVGERDAVG